MNARVRVVGWALVALGGLGLAGGVARLIYDRFQQHRGEAEGYFAVFFILIAVGYLLPSLACGVGLVRGERWARLPAALLSAMLMLAFPFGTAVGLFALWALWEPSAEAAHADQGTPAPPAVQTTTTLGATGPPPRQRLGALLAIIWVGAGFIVLLGGGFRLHDQDAPSFLGWGFWPAIVLFVAISIYAAAKWRPMLAPLPRFNPVAGARRAAELKRDRQAREDERRQRLAALETDPVRRAYADRIRAGEAWSDAQIDYHLEPGATVTCDCLRATEVALRGTGADIRLAQGASIIAPVRVNESAWRAAFQPPTDVDYHEFYNGGRSAEDDPAAFLRCNKHNSAIEVLHPACARPDTVWFPAPLRA